MSEQQKELVKRLTIKQVLAKIGANVEKPPWFSCRYGESPSIRYNVNDDITVLAYAVGRIVAYVAYENRGMVYGYALRKPMIRESWYNWKAAKMSPNAVKKEIEEMINDGFDGEIYYDPEVARKEKMGVYVGKIIFTTHSFVDKSWDWQKKQHKLSEPKEINTFPQNEYNVNTYYVFKFKNGVRFFRERYPRTNRGVGYKSIYYHFSDAIHPATEFKAVVEQAKKIPLAKRKETCVFYDCDFSDKSEITAHIAKLGTKKGKNWLKSIPTEQELIDELKRGATLHNI